MIAPLRVSFDDRERIKEVFVVNESSQRATYRIGLQDKQALSNGGYQNMTEGYAGSAKEILKYSPRQFTLDPGQSQKVKIMARRPSSLKSGEYRSHLSFTALPVVSEESEEDDNDVGSSLQVNILLNYSIPVIVRKGQYSTNFNIDKLQLQRTQAGYQAMVDLSKQHSYSGYGSLKVYWKRSATSRETQVGELNEYKFFHELNSSQAKVVLPDFNGNSGYYRVVFEGRGEFTGQVLAEFSTRI